MVSIPAEQQLRDALSAAGLAHHDYEANCLGDFTTPTLLTRWLDAVSGDGDWSQNAAAHVLSNIPHG